MLSIGLSTFSAGIVAAQTSAVQTLIIPQGIRLPEDPVAAAGLISSLRGWLAQRDQSDSLNEYLRGGAATSVFMDELRNIDWWNKRDSASNCRCYLGNVVFLDSTRCRVQLNYMGLHEDTPILRACCTVLAQREGDKWTVSSTLEENTAGWKTMTIGNCVFHYRESLNARKAGEFVKQIASYDKRLGVSSVGIDFYSCDDKLEATRLVGEDYRLEYNGAGLLELASNYGARTVVVSGEPRIDGFNTWDTHDWWHARLHRVVSSKTINRPVDEGMAYLYGGSWRIYTWADVLTMFKAYAAANPKADWLALYKNGTNFAVRPWPLGVANVINSLIVQRLEKEKGFFAALPLLTCGQRQAGDANYFAALKQVVGVDEAGFNGYVAELINQAKVL